MAVRDIGFNNNIIIYYDEGADFGTLADPDPDLSDGTTGALAEMTPDSGVGIVPMYPEPVVKEAQGDIQIAFAADVGRQGGSVDFKTMAIAGVDELAPGNNPSGGRYSLLLETSWGPHLGTVAATDIASVTSPSVFDLTDATNYVPGQLISVENPSPASTDPRVEQRAIIAVSGAQITLDRALSFTPVATDVVRPLRTFAPTRYPTDHKSLYVKRRVREYGSIDGIGFDFRGVGLNCAIEVPSVGQSPRYAFTGQADNWNVRTATADLDVDTSSLYGSQLPPILAGSKVFYDDAELEVAAFTASVGTSIAEKAATCGAHGRAPWTHFMEGEGPSFTLTVQFDEAWYTRWSANSTKELFMTIGVNSSTNDDGLDHSYLCLYSPGVQIRDISEVNRNGLVYLDMTMQTVRNPLAVLKELDPLYIGIAGKS